MEAQGPSGLAAVADAQTALRPSSTASWCRAHPVLRLRRALPRVLKKTRVPRNTVGEILSREFNIFMLSCGCLLDPGHKASQSGVCGTFPLHSAAWGLPLAF